VGLAQTAGRNAPPGARQRACRRRRGRAAAGEWAAAPRLTSGGHSTCRVQSRASVGSDRQVREADKSATMSGPRTTKQGVTQGGSSAAHARIQAPLWTEKHKYNTVWVEMCTATRVQTARAGRHALCWRRREGADLIGRRARHLCHGERGRQGLRHHHADACRGERRWRRLPRQPPRRGSRGCRQP